MAAYDFNGLSPSDFEALSHDLLEISLGVPLQSFVTGRDNGIDLRHAPSDGRDWIVQCKHYVRSGFAKLRSHLANKELPKIQTLNPSRYILVTSVGLSPSNIDELFALLTPYCQSKHDIIGQDGLNDLLRTNPSIEQKHFKLWLTSEAVLSRVLHNDVFVQSMLTKEQIKARLGLYVQTENFEKVRQMLNASHVCILSGVPGVGKTTLAEMMLVDLMMKDWEVITIEQNVNEGQRVYKCDDQFKQVFYYDDFLGQISTGEKLGKNEDRALVQLIKAVAGTSNKRFILTTREYILAQAKVEHGHLAKADTDIFRFVVSCDDYSELDKARILANHLYFASVPQEHIAVLIKDQIYRTIISHRNYSPRIIEWMTMASEVKLYQPNEYPAAFLNGLENPSKLWEHAFENAISDAARHLLLVLGSCGNGISLDDLQKAFEAFYFARGGKYGFSVSPTSFFKALNELEGNFLRIERNPFRAIVSCHSPSVLDFLDKRLGDCPNDATDLLRYAIFFEQVSRLFRVFKTQPSNVTGQATAQDAILVKNAIDRTLFDSAWIHSYSSPWDRLRICCQIGAHIADSNLRTSIQNQIDAQLEKVSAASGDYVGILSLLEAAEGCQWIDRSTIYGWIQQIQSDLLLRESDFGESLEGLCIIAQWIESKERVFDSQQTGFIQDNLSKAVCHEVDYNTNWGDFHQIGSDLELVRELSRLLPCDLTESVERLDRALCDCERPKDDDDNKGQSHPSTSCNSSIESLFDALLE